MGRWQIIGNNPLIVCDTGHNDDGIKAVVNQIKILHLKLYILFLELLMIKIWMKFYNYYLKMQFIILQKLIFQEQWMKKNWQKKH